MENNSSTIKPQITESMNTQYIGFGSVAMVANFLIIFITVRNKDFFKNSALMFGLALGDFIDGLALVCLASVRQWHYNNGNPGALVSPSYCMWVLTPLFLLGSQIPTSMFFVIGIERILAVKLYTWFYKTWTTKRSWLVVGTVYCLAILSVGVSYVIVLTRSSTDLIANECALNSVVGKVYSGYTYGISIVAGSGAAAASIFATVSFTMRKRRMRQAGHITNHVRTQFNVTVNMLCVSIFDVCLVVVPNILLVLGSGFDLTVNSVRAMALQLITLRSSLNIFVFIFLNSEFRAAAFRAFGLQSWLKNVVIPVHVGNNAIRSETK